MTKSVTQATKSTQEKREKKTYDGTLIPEGYVLAPVWLKRSFVNDSRLTDPIPVPRTLSMA